MIVFLCVCIVVFCFLFFFLALWFCSFAFDFFGPCLTEKFECGGVSMVRFT